MLVRNAVHMAMDAAVIAAIKAGHGSQVIAELEQYGIVFDARLGAVDFLKAESSKQIKLRRTFDPATQKMGIACDAQPELVTVSNSGIPQYLSNYLDPRVIQVLVSPMKAAQIYGETQKGSWLTSTLQFKVQEYTGETSSYGDFNNNGSAGQNLNFPVTQTYHYQTITQWGQKEAEEAGLAGVDWASGQNLASVLVLNKFQNKSYFYGISGLSLYGILNHPDLPAPIVATAAWNLAATSAEVIYEDIRRLFVQIQLQTNGLVDSDASMTLALSNVIQPALLKTNQYNVNVWDQLKKNFPNLRVVNAPEYNTGSAGAGQLVQLIVDSVEGQPTGTAAYTEKLRSHNIVTDLSGWKQKKSQGTAGFILFFAPGVAQMTGM